MSRFTAIIAGIFSMVLALWFLGWLVVSINVLPLWIVIGTTVGMLLFDFYQSLKEDTQSDPNNGV